MADRRVTHINPRSDLEFVSLVDRLADTVSDAAGLQSQLRLTYPRAVVRPRDLSGETVEVWYVYRDGRWTDPRPL